MTPWLPGKPASIAHALWCWLCGGERWGGDEKSQAPPFFPFGGAEKLSGPKSKQLWRLLDGRPLEAGKGSARSVIDITVAQDWCYDRSATLNKIVRAC